MCGRFGAGWPEPGKAQAGGWVGGPWRTRRNATVGRPQAVSRGPLGTLRQTGLPGRSRAGIIAKRRSHTSIRPTGSRCCSIRRKCSRHRTTRGTTTIPGQQPSPNRKPQQHLSLPGTRTTLRTHAIHSGRRHRPPQPSVPEQTLNHTAKLTRTNHPQRTGILQSTNHRREVRVRQSGHHRLPQSSRLHRVTPLHRPIHRPEATPNHHHVGKLIRGPEFAQRIEKEPIPSTSHTFRTPNTSRQRPSSLIKTLRPPRRTHQLHTLRARPVQQRLLPRRRAPSHKHRPPPIDPHRFRQCRSPRRYPPRMRIRRRIPLQAPRHHYPLLGHPHGHEPPPIRRILRPHSRQRAEHSTQHRPQLPIPPERSLADPAIDHRHRHPPPPTRPNEVGPKLQFRQAHHVRPHRVQKSPHRERRIQRIPPHIARLTIQLPRPRQPRVCRRRHDHPSMRRQQGHQRPYRIGLTHRHRVQHHTRPTIVALGRQRLDPPEPLGPTPTCLAKPPRRRHRRNPQIHRVCQLPDHAPE